jgi:hypothetical protein
MIDDPIIDVVVCATGFNATLELRFPIIDLDGYALSYNWGKDKTKESYMSCSVARFSNFFSKLSRSRAPPWLFTDA